MRKSAISTLFLAILSLLAQQALAYDPPAGGLLLPIYGSPQALASGASVTGLDAPWADRLNPAASAGQQRTVLDAGYGLITDFAGQGIGTALGLGLSLPRAYGVWGAGLRYTGTPASMSELPLGGVFEARASLAKDLFPELFVGAGLNLALGGNSGFGWGLGLDLGLVHKLGDLGALKDFRYGLVLSGLGKGYTTPFPPSSSSYPAAFSLSAGAKALLVKSDALRLGLGLDLSFPSFQDLGFALSAGLEIGPALSLKAGWGFPSLRELVAGSSKSLLPSFGLSALFPLVRKADESYISSQGWDRSEIQPSLSAAPLYGDIWAIGAGVTIPLGLVDRTPPLIQAAFPASSWGPFYLSPNNDGSQDLLEIPLKISDQRYLLSYLLTVRKAGEPAALRSIANKESRPETQGLSGLWDRLVYVKKGVPVPEKLSWNGVTDSGEVAADGEYEIYVEALDDNGNRAEVGPLPVVVDNTPPAAELGFPADSLIFSPDGDGNKDSILFPMKGSAEDLWSARILDSSGKARRLIEYRAEAPRDFRWDGRDDEGAVLPDGVYVLQLSATDRAGNATSRRVDNIVVNTQQPPINLAIDTGAFSPNGDGVKDSVRLVPSVPVKTGLSSFRLSVLDRDRKEVWSLSGLDPAALREAYSFDGRGADLAALPEGNYQARLSVSYVNGHSPVASSPSFLLDLTPPRATVSVDRAAFNPTGASGGNLVHFSQSGSGEERWTGEILGPEGARVRSWSFGPLPDPALEWDGTDEAGALLPDGIYSYRLGTTDRAGNSFVSAPASVSLDTEKKAARLAADLRAFSPNGDGQKDIVRFSAQVQSNDRVRSYELSILAAEAADGPQRTWKGEGGLPPSFTWNGLRDDRAAAPEGRYLAKLGIRYLNDDLVEAQSLPFVLDLTPPSIELSASPLLFSPNGDGRLDLVTFAQKSRPGDDWEGRIVGAGERTVRSFSWKAQAADFSWDGSDEAGNRAPDGAYRYEVSSTDAAGNRGQASLGGIRLDARQPQVFVTASAPGLSPNADLFMDDIAFSLIVNLSEGISSWRFSLVDAAGAERAFFGGQGGDLPPRIVWDGKTSAGQAAEGEYRGIFRVDYLKGDRVEARTGGVAVDISAPKVDFKLSPEFFSPDNDGVDDELLFELSVADASEIAAWRLEIDEASVEESPGQKPRERLFVAWTGTGLPTRRIQWDGRSAKGELVESATDYPFYFDIADVYGNKTRLSGAAAVDVLVIREGDRLKIKVPSIVFRPNFADFEGLEPETLERNAKVVGRIAEILNKFKDYRIAIEGHANSVAKIYGYSEERMVAEEQKELIPLSTKRAELVQELLVKNGVDARRLSVIGRGSSAPVVDFKDAVNRWKNRRVEFILIKNP